MTDKDDLHCYDPKCYELAEYFVDGANGIHPDKTAELARWVQAAVESWLVDNKPRIVSRRVTR